MLELSKLCLVALSQIFKCKDVFSSSIHDLVLSGLLFRIRNISTLHWSVLLGLWLFSRWLRSVLYLLRHRLELLLKNELEGISLDLVLGTIFLSRLLFNQLLQLGELV